MSPPIRAELHSHTIFSDGAFEPETVARMCAERGVRLWSLTDHDTCLGCPRAARAAEKDDVAFLPGIEISAFAGRSIHVLGYGVDPVGVVMTDYSDRRLAARAERMEKMVEKLHELGAPVALEDVLAIAGEGAIARPHLAQALVDAGHVADIPEAFDTLIGNDGPGYVETTWPTVPEAIEIIGDAGGIAVLAHPALYGKDDEIAGWADAGLVGIEVRHPRHDAAAEKRYAKIAGELGLLQTASSDFHGPQHISAGFFGSTEIPAEWIEALEDALHRRLIP